MTPIAFTVLGNPPSLNHLYPTGRNGRRFPSAEGKKWKALVAWSAKAAGARPIEGDVSVTLRLYFSSRRPDLDNAVKPILDALGGGVCYANDRQVHELNATKHLDRLRPRVEVEVAGVRS